MTPGNWSGNGWAITVTDDLVDVRSKERDFQVSGDSVGGLETRRSWFRWFLYVDGDRAVRLRGLGGAGAGKLRQALRRAAFSEQFAAALAWDRQVRSTMSSASEQQRWVPHEQVDELVRSRPDKSLIAEITAAGIESQLSQEELSGVSALEADIVPLFAELNEHILEAELRDRRGFFERIEESPLTSEQARAVVCFDNRVHLLAAAGSGKTSVMVARAAYAVDRGFVSPDRVLLLAFNRAAAKELQERIDARFAAAGIPSEGVRASTFHSYGLDVIGRATQHRPRLAPWLDAGRDTQVVEGIVDQLRDADETFRYKWDLYRLLLAPAPVDVDGGTPDGYDRSTRETGFMTFRGEVVRSAGERMIADWLFINGVDYRYEHPYSVDVSDETYSQYRPDFYYPDVDVWHEHWALDRNGKPPPDFHRYAESMVWKKGLHVEHGTKLVESTWHNVVFGDGLQRLQRDLSRHGVTFDWNPDREIPGDVKPLQHADLARLVRTFMAHVKSNVLDESSIEARLAGERRNLAGFRTQLFLDLYWPIHREWDRRLRAESYVDFEDMLVLAAEHLEAGRADMGHKLILVDELQDASQARARLVRGLLRCPDRFLLAVGDDWQAINRFAGADISVMTQFEDWFGAGPQLALTTTFRCPQAICDVASEFVMRNPRQFRKTVRSAQTDPGPPVTLVQADDVNAAIARYFEQLSRSVGDGTVKSGRNGKVTVDVLGRYRFDRDTIPDQLPANLEVTFRTAHSAKGLEADYIVLPRVVSGRYGFPSEIADDPVLDLAMAAPDDFPNAEERRLFYVALTRARRQVTLVTQRGRESAFVVELLRDGLVVPVNDTGQPTMDVRVCTECGEGTMVRRTGRYGAFLGCSRFPACRNTTKLK